MLSILFDIDDTLYHRQDPFTLAYDKLFKDRWDLDRSRLFHRFLKYGNALFEDSMSGRIPMEEMYTRRIQTAMADFQAEITKEEALEFQAAYLWEQEHLKLNPHTRELLQFCRTKPVFLAIITNGPSKHQRIKYDSLQLKQWIPEENVMASGDIGINKPDVGIFHAAAQKWNLTPEETYYVGDSYEHDIVSSKSVGWHTVWLDRTCRSQSEACPAADYIAATEEELLHCIKKLVLEFCP